MLKVESILADPSVSYWVKDAIRSGLKRDPVDVANDAALVAEVFAARAKEILG